jgi:hypothetical protein
VGAGLSRTVLAWEGSGFDGYMMVYFQFDGLLKFASGSLAGGITILGTVPYNIGMRHWRIRHDSALGRIIGEYSIDGETWSVLGFDGGWTDGSLANWPIYTRLFIHNSTAEVARFLNFSQGPHERL